MDNVGCHLIENPASQELVQAFFHPAQQARLVNRVTMDGEEGGREEGGESPPPSRGSLPFCSVASPRGRRKQDRIEWCDASAGQRLPSLGRAGCCRDGLVDGSCRPSATPHVVREGEGLDASICSCGKGSHSNRSSSSEFE